MAETTTWSVRGMTCEHCVRAVREELSSLDGVVGVEVDLGTSQVQVHSEGHLDPATVAAAVAEAGYEVAP